MNVHRNIEGVPCAAKHTCLGSRVTAHHNKTWRTCGTAPAETLRPRRPPRAPPGRGGVSRAPPTPPCPGRRRRGRGLTAPRPPTPAMPLLDQLLQAVPDARLQELAKDAKAKARSLKEELGRAEAECAALEAERDRRCREKKKKRGRDEDEDDSFEIVVQGPEARVTLEVKPSTPVQHVRLLAIEKLLDGVDEVDATGYRLGYVLVYPGLYPRQIRAPWPKTGSRRRIPRQSSTS